MINNRYVYLLAVLYTTIVTIGCFSHVQWFDEIQAINVSLYFSNLLDLSLYLRYESQPPMWYWIIRFMDVFCSQPLLYINYLASLASGYLLLFKFPCSKWIAILYLFGYYAIFEYAVFFRPYSIIQLQVILCAYLFKIDKKPAPRGVTVLLLGSMSLMHFFGLLLSFFILLHLLCSKRIRYSDAIAVMIIFLFSTFHIIQPISTQYFPQWYTSFNFERFLQVISSLGFAFIPVPKIENAIPQWNSFLLGYSLPSLLISVTVIALCVRELRNSKISTNIFILYLLTISIVFYVKYIGFLRHSGSILLLFLYLVLVNNIDLKAKSVKLIFSLSLATGFIFFYSSIAHDFSGARLISEYIKNKKLSILYADNMQVATSSLVGSNTKLFSLDRDSVEHFYRYDSSPTEVGVLLSTSEGHFSSYINQLREQDCEKGCFYLSRYYFNEKTTSLKLILKSDHVLNKSERLYLYIFKN